jgi:hypothetical protein
MRWDVWIIFSRHSPNWWAVQNYYSPSQETTDPIYRKGQWEGKNSSPSWQVGLQFYSPSLNSTCSWRVVIRTPGNFFCMYLLHFFFGFAGDFFPWKFTFCVDNVIKNLASRRNDRMSYSVQGDFNSYPQHSVVKRLSIHSRFCFLDLQSSQLVVFDFSDNVHVLGQSIMI